MRTFDALAEDSGRAGFGGTLAELVLSAQGQQADSLSVVAAITQVAVYVIPGADGAAVVAPDGPGQLKAHAMHGDLPPAVIGLQNEAGQGPCLDAVTGTHQIRIADVATEGRWPLFGGRAAAAGALSMICTPLVAGAAAYGSLSLISRTAGAFAPEAAKLAEMFAAHATIMLAGQERQRQLNTALATRDVIGQAKGILMERYRATPDVAFALLAQASQDTNTKLHDVADELCRTGKLPGSGRRGSAAKPVRRVSR